MKKLDAEISKKIANGCAEVITKILRECVSSHIDVSVTEFIFYGDGRGCMNFCWKEDSKEYQKVGLNIISEGNEMKKRNFQEEMIQNAYLQIVFRATSTILCRAFAKTAIEKLQAGEELDVKKVIEEICIIPKDKGFYEKVKKETDKLTKEFVDRISNYCE